MESDTEFQRDQRTETQAFISLAALGYVYLKNFFMV